MGTRSTTKFYENYKGEKYFIGGIYCQFDGYLSGHGKALRDYLKGKKIINGISGQTLREAFNGIDCLGAAVIAHLKNKIGSVYLCTEENKQAYNYKIWPEGESIFIEVECGEIIYSGNIDDMPTSDG